MGRFRKKLEGVAQSAIKAVMTPILITWIAVVVLLDEVESRRR
jgi:hypothetical protein